MPTSWLGGGCRSLSQGRLWGFLGSRSAVSSSTATSPVHLSRSLQHKQAWRSLSANARGQQSIVADHGDEKKAEKLASMLLDQNRFALSRAITLVESTKEEHRRTANKMLANLLQRSSKDILQTTLRIGISGPPGVGKSTFIEAFGMHLINEGRRVAVLSIDPSSSLTGGSILGDKTRMIDLSRDNRAYVRPSPNRGVLGGVAATTNEAATLCEHAGFDIVIIETVGVGQSEITVRDISDCMLLLVNPAGGDELQGIKKGVVELADLVVVNKADGDLLPAARRTKTDYMHALQLLWGLKPKHGDTMPWKPKCCLCSSVGKGETPKATVMSVWKEIQKFQTYMLEGDRLTDQRNRQRKKWMWSQLEGQLLESVTRVPRVSEMIRSTTLELEEGRLTPRVAATAIVDWIVHELRRSRSK